MKNKNLLLVGPIFFKNGYPVDQMGKLKFKLINEGYSVMSVSIYRNRLLRLLDTVFSMIFKFYSYDVVIIQCFSFKAFILEDIASFIASIFKKKVIITIRGGAFLVFSEKNPCWVKRVFNRANLITTPSIFLRNELHLLGYKINHTSNFIDIDRFDYNYKFNEAKKILWVRAFHEIYRPDLAIESFRIVKQKYPSATLTMIGPDQGDLDKTLQLIKTHNLNDSIFILGIIDNIFLPDYYSEHSVFITTTKYESFGVAIFEAASSGIPIVSTCVGEIPFLWKDSHDILFSDGSPLDFASKIFRVFEDRKLAENLSKNARENAEKHTWESVKNKWIDHINNI